MNTANMRSGIVAVVGRTNVGKSTLVNRIIGEKVSIVSPLVQTTRNRIRCVLTEGRGQIVLLDTPGVHKAETQLGTQMNRMARAATDGVDVVMLVLDANVRPRMEDEGWFRRLAEHDAPCLFVLNKQDAGGSRGEDYKRMWDAVVVEAGTRREAGWVVTSAVDGTGIDELVGALFALVPPGGLLFPDDMLSDYPTKLAMADVIREKLIVDLHEEVPYAIAVWVDDIDKTEAQWSVRATVYVNRSSQKGIVIGHKGRVLRKVRRQSATELSTMFDVPVDVDLWVKVEKDWQENFWMLKKLGYVQQ